uniref:Uncharacterized protein n=1 Tax=Elaeophora elaphi TaxID=1147741 RepID=A0A0R3RWS3_9BILA
MVNTEDDEQPENEKYASDGRYTPRLFFLDSATTEDNSQNCYHPLDLISQIYTKDLNKIIRYLFDK